MELRRAVLDAGVREEDILPWADFDHPVADSYGRKLVYKEDRFEIMVMSWQPGDFSGLHDHGFTQYGTVQVFGEAEHAVFHVEEDTIRTLARWTLKPGEAISVSHSLVHQMGNPGDRRFLSLHVYGTPEPKPNITGEARVFDLHRQVIQRVDGGVFFALPPGDVVREEPGPEADFPTHLRYLIELQRRLQRMADAGIASAAEQLPALLEALQSPRHRERISFCLRERTDAAGHSTDSVYWKIINQELREMARLQRGYARQAEDAFHRYAELYDAVICQPCLDDFMAGYLRFFADKFAFDYSAAQILSVGCGTGLVEAHLIRELGAAHDKLLGMDISPAMVSEARRRIRAEEGDIFTFETDAGRWDLLFSGLNVFHYLDHRRFDEAVQRAAGLLRPGGWFVGDFITPDHIRWYPNVLFSGNGEVISLRTPHLVEEGGALFQESEIVNVSFQSGYMEVTDAGRHRRYLPALHRVRRSFETAFGGRVELFDALSLEPIPADADSCASTRYVVVARKERP
jgi:SAM-dependent methyltransferase/predicted metal-dependent enzyme (double-stranded beta helix superfamily)